MAKTQTQLYSEATTRNMNRFRQWIHTFKPDYWKQKSDPLNALKSELGIKSSDTTYDAELTAALG